MSGVVVLILGMVFTSRGFPQGTFGYKAFTTLAALFIVCSTLVFASLLVFEVRVGRRSARVPYMCNCCVVCEHSDWGWFVVRYGGNSGHGV